MIRWLLRCPSLIVLLLLAPAGASANVGPPYRGGQVTGDPIGIVDVEIKRETLTIDMRPVADHGLAEVEAIYRLDNRGATKTLDLLFASGSSTTSEFRVWLDDVPIRIQPAPAEKLPASWQPPGHTPALPNTDGSLELQYHPGRATPQSFKVTIPPGEHTLKVRYGAQLVENLYGTPTLLHQFAYVLSPARSWAGFGGLDVTVRVPDGWRAVSSPKLDREGDTLRGTFADVPADALTMTLQAPAGWLYYLLRCVSLGLLAVAGVGGAVFCWKGGQRWNRWTISLGLGILWGIAFSAAGFFTQSLDDALPAGQASRYGYRPLFAMLQFLLGSMLLVPVGFVIALIGAARSRRSGNP